MLNKKYILATIATFLLAMVFLIAKVSPQTDRNTLPNPKINTPSPSPSPSPTTFPIDANTDLEKELESVNPKILDSDFE